jgi:CHAT domain-containing protein/Tfp pilus assembly protein PilF
MSRPVHASRALLTIALVLCLAAAPQNILAQDTATYATKAKAVSDLVVEGMKLEVKGNYQEALPILERALALAEKSFDPDDGMIYICLSSLGTLHTDTRDFGPAETILKRALTMIETSRDSREEWVADAARKLAVVYDYRGDYSRAEPLYERALALREKVFGPDKLEVADSANSLAVLSMQKGDYDRAEKLLLRVLAIREKLLGEDNALTGVTLNNLGYVYAGKKDHAKAEAFYQRAIAAALKTKGPESVDLATDLNNLGQLYRDTDLAKARPLLERALAIRERLLGPNDPDVGSSLNNLAVLSWKEGNLKEAEQLLLRTLAITEKTNGPTHPHVATVLNNLAFLYQAKGDFSQAISFLTRSNEISEHNVALILATGSEDQKRLYMATLSGDTNGTVSLHVNGAPGNAKAARLALTTILQRKGRILDAMSNQFAALRQHLGIVDQVLVDQLSATRAELATLVLKGPEKSDPSQYAAEVSKLEARAQDLEKKITERAGEFRLQSEAITIERVQAAIPRDAALIEIERYRPATVKAGQSVTWGADRYVVYALKHEGDPAWIELGDAAQIDRHVNDLLVTLRGLSDFRESARAMDEAVLRPIRKLLGDVRNVLISPDGALNLVPFAALIDEQKHYAVEDFTFTYLTSGRDLLRLETTSASRQGPVVVANPQFDQTSGPTVSIVPVAPGNDRNRSREFQARFAPLDATADEARDVSALLSGVRVLTGSQATESALKQLRGPSILHIATHGFFLKRPPDQKPIAGDQRAPASINGLAVMTLSENPLLRSGLALAGANQRDGGNGEDGILTALEATGLDLWGTKLVVLSACETGVGDVQNGEGVYGLRRALVLAGAESEMISLWKVNDDATRDLMVDFYKRLESGVGRSEALRQVQLKMLKTADHNHPYFWAAFILSGDWRKLD